MLLNMLMVSSVVLVVFAVIFITAYTRVQNEHEMRVAFGTFDNTSYYHDTSFTWFSEEGLDRYSSWIFSDTVEVEAEEWGRRVYMSTPRRISPYEGVSFSVILDSDNNMLEIDSVVNLSSDAITRVTELTAGDINTIGTVSIDGRRWSAVVVPFNAILHRRLELGDGFAISGSSIINNDLSYIRFVDVTESYEMLQSLALTLIAATLVVLTVFFFISRFFAKQAIKPMEEAWEKQRQFITDASHELKTPLSVINANCGVLYSNQDEPVTEQIRWVDSISRATDRMTGLVGSLLSLASMDDTQFELQSSSFDLGEEMTAAVSEMEVVADDKGITMNMEIEADVMIESDKDQVRKVLSTLMENAVKYTQINGEITTTLTKDKRHIICAIKNSGPGIPQDDLPNVFNRFYRGDPARSSDNSGYGLGLAIAEAIADQLGAKLTVDSVVDEYTEFKLVFYC